MTWTPPVPITQWAPTGDQTAPGVLRELYNLIPTERGWRSAYSLTPVGAGTLTATCEGAALIMSTAGQQILVAGTSTKLWVRSGATWTDVTGADVYAATSDLRWRFAAMGDYILAATASNTIQVSLAGATFTAVAASPKAALLEVWRESYEVLCAKSCSVEIH